MHWNMQNSIYLNVGFVLVRLVILVEHLEQHNCTFCYSNVEDDLSAIYIVGKTCNNKDNEHILIQIKSEVHFFKNHEYLK